MTEEKAKKASELLAKIQNIQEYKDVVDIPHGEKPKFTFSKRVSAELNVIRQVVFPTEYNERFLVVADQIIQELKDELEKL